MAVITHYAPRTRLRTVLDNLAEQGLTVRAGFEYEFFLFDETPHSIRDKGYRNLTPITPGNFGYSVLRTSALGKEFTEFMNYCADIDCELEGLHCETGPGVWEAALASKSGLEAADRASLFKTYGQGLLSAPIDVGDLHGEVVDGLSRTKRPPASKSQRCRRSKHFLRCSRSRGYIGKNAPGRSGLATLLARVFGHARANGEQLILVWLKEPGHPPRRLGVLKTAPLRFVSFPAICIASASKYEWVVQDANPYLVQAAALAAMNIGMQEQLTPNEPVAGNAYEAEDDLPLQFHFASNLSSAANRFGESTAAKKQFGETFVEHFAMTRRWEASEYHRTINSWQLETLF